jgi:hypothetical protein
LLSVNSMHIGIVYLVFFDRSQSLTMSFEDYVPKS